jgi:hypothetical protein
VDPLGGGNAVTAMEVEGVQSSHDTLKRNLSTVGPQEGGVETAEEGTTLLKGEVDHNNRKVKVELNGKNGNPVVHLWYWMEDWQGLESADGGAELVVLNNHSMREEGVELTVETGGKECNAPIASEKGTPMVVDMKCDQERRKHQGRRRSGAGRTRRIKGVKVREKRTIEKGKDQNTRNLWWTRRTVSYPQFTLSAKHTWVWSIVGGFEDLSDEEWATWKGESAFTTENNGSLLSRVEVNGRAAIGDFLENPGNKVPVGIHHAIREHQDFLLQVVTRSEVLSIHILMPSTGASQCLWHHANRRQRGDIKDGWEEDFEGYWLTGTSGQQRKKTEPMSKHMDGHLNCGCPIKEAVFYLYMWKM